MNARFDRLRPRAEAEPGVSQPVDPQGKRALFSTAPAVPAFGSITLDCSGCGARSVLSVRQTLRAALPSVHLPLLHGRYSSWMRCPACGRRRWVRARVRL